MKKTFNKKEENKYLQEIQLFNNYPNFILPIKKHYETDSYFIIEYNDFQYISSELNKPQIDQIVSFLKFLQQNNINLDYFSQQTIFLTNDTLLFTINNTKFDHLSINNSIFLDHDLNQDDYEFKNNIYMFGILLYKNYYNKLPNFNKLSKINKKPYLKFNNINYFSSYINRIIELCIYQNKDHITIYDLIINDSIQSNITHRLYFVDEVCNALYFSIYEGNLKDSLYWGSELFGVGEYHKIIEELIKLLLFKIGTLYQGIFEYIYRNLNNFNKNHNRKKKEVIIDLITLLCNCKKNSLLDNINSLIYKNIIHDDLKLKININNVFNLLEMDMFKMVKILVLQKKDDIIWTYLSQKGNKNYKYMTYFNKINKNSTLLACLDFYRNKYYFNRLPDFKVNNNTYKYFGYNLKRNKNQMPNYYLNFDTIRGTPEVIRKTEYYGFDRYKEFKDLKIINYFTDEQIISNFGFIIFSMSQNKDVFDYRNRYDYRLDNDYYKQCFQYLMKIENNTNFIYTNYDYLKCKLITSNDNKTDQYNLVELDTE